MGRSKEPGTDAEEQDILLQGLECKEQHLRVAGKSDQGVRRRDTQKIGCRGWEIGFGGWGMFTNWNLSLHSSCDLVSALRVRRRSSI